MATVQGGSSLASVPRIGTNSPSFTINVITAPIETEFMELTIVSGEALSGHRAVTVDGFYADKDNASDDYKVLGITQGAVGSGSQVTITTFGEISNVGWNWTIGDPIFLGTNGNLTQTVPVTGFNICLGIPRETTTIFVNISEPIFIA